MRYRIPVLIAALCLLLSACAYGEGTVPDTAGVIEDEAFRGNGELRELTLPAGLVRIGDRAFADCVNLTSVRCLADDAQIGEGVFDGSGVEKVACRPGSTMEAYALAHGYEVVWAGSFSVECDTRLNGAAGLPITWRVTDMAPGLSGECLFSYVLLRDGVREAAAEDTRELQFTFTPSAAGEYALQVSAADGGRGETVECAAVPVRDGVYMGVYEQDGNARTKDEVKWRVLAVEGDTALLIADRILKNGSYFNPSWIKYKYCCWDGSLIGSSSDVNYWFNIKSAANRITGITPDHVPMRDRTWGTDADLFSVHARHWCNSVFYNGAFTDEERERILPTVNANRDSEKYGTAGGPDTEDNVFFLSMEELMRYMPTAESRKCLMTWCASRETDKNVGRFWWLRSPGAKPWFAVYVQGTTGGISVYGSDVGHDMVGYRPCVRIRLGG